MKLKLIALVVFLLTLTWPYPARADGIIIPEPPPCPRPDPCPPIPAPMSQLIIRYHHVQVTIEDQVAVTHVDQVFYNPNNWTVEGTYVFPLPRDASVTAFTLWVDGRPVEGQVLDAGQARQKYEQVVSQLRDPALLEWAGQGAVQAHVFPIPPQGERRIELEYTQALAAEGGLVRYIYPLSTEKLSAEPLEEVAISLDISSQEPIRAVYSPSHNVAVIRKDDHHVQAGWEATNVLPGEDFGLYYSIGSSQALHLITFRDSAGSSDPDGFFLLLLAPQPDTRQESIAKDVILVLDRSGSMEGEKFLQAQDALRYVLQHLNPGDRFNIIAFSTGLESFAGGLRTYSEVDEAQRWVDRLAAAGSTDINRALLEAAAVVPPAGDGQRPTYLIFLTDGLPTEGVIDSAQILQNFAGNVPEHLRLFAFGVGYDVDTFLLDSLAQAHHGSSTYVLPDERLDETLSAFYEKISTPVLTDLSLDIAGVSTYDLYPSPLPDLFRGSQIILVGRYRQGGTGTLTLTGQVDGETQTFSFPEQVFPEETPRQGPAAALPRLWATRKIGYLLNEIRLHGPNQESIDQIVRLSIRYGIVTPYTSYLVEEDVPLGAAGQEELARQQFNEMEVQATAPTYGQDAVEKAARQGALAAAEAPAPVDEISGQAVRIAGSHAFVRQDGRWVDTAFDPELMQTVKVAFLSVDYFALAEANPDLAAAFSLGDAVIAVSGRTAYEVVPEDQQVSPIDQPAATPTTPVEAQPPEVLPDPERTPVAPAPAGKSPAGVACLGGLLPLLGIIVAVQRRKVPPQKRR